MVERQHQYGLVLVEEQACAQQRAARQVKGLVDVVLQQSPALLTALGGRQGAQVVDRQVDDHGWADGRQRRAVDGREGGPEDLVPGNQRREARRQPDAVHVRRPADRHRDVVERAPWRELRQKPQALLGERRRGR